MSHPTWTLRPALPADAPRLTELAQAAKGHWGYPQDWLARWEPDLTLTPEYIAQHRMFVAEEDGVVIGVSGIEDHGARWILEHVWIDPAHQGRGLGQALVRRCLDAARAVRPGVVEIVAEPNATGFYEKLGARRVGAIPAPMPGAPDRELPLYEIVLEPFAPDSNP
ncbi:MAG TPA: GNAT family N-acetyltransferase [Thermoanaerobaculia bacterium]|jgi:RimJ/RimL family protein N-acetyltransferase|nr:GNAT family N-acetyltransferase [Thermoanaerobaculia bacterium]